MTAQKDFCIETSCFSVNIHCEIYLKSFAYKNLKTLTVMIITYLSLNASAQEVEP